jgi:hypothetical protein
LKVKCPVIATADHSHSGSGYPLEADAEQLDIMDGHDYWRHPSVPPFRHSPMVNEPFNSTVVELSRTAMSGKPYAVSEVNNPFPNQFACEGVPILAAYGRFLDWDAVVWYTFEPKRSSDWKPVLTEPFDMSHDPVKMPEMAAGALMFLRGDIQAAKTTVERSYSREEAWDSVRLDGTNRPFFTPGYPASMPLLHGSRISSFACKSTGPVSAPAASQFKSDTGELVWSTNPQDAGLVTIDTPRSQGLIGFVKANGKRVTHLAAGVSNNFCAIILCSLELKPISSAHRLLLVTGSRVGNSGMTWNAEGTRPVHWGASPTALEPVTGTIILSQLTKATRVTALALDGAGRPIGSPLTATRKGDSWELAVGKIVTPWYEVTVDR